MKFKCKKIKGIDKSVCTCEQKIAYNYAFASHISYGDKYKACKSEIQKSRFLTEVRGYIVDDILRNEDMKKYNIDVIFIALNNGLRVYFDKAFIASDYKKIGEVFAVPYEII